MITFKCASGWTVLRHSLSLLLCASVLAAPASADEADAKRIFKAMTDYVDAQDVITFDYDSVLEVVTVDGEKLQLTSSGQLAMDRPDKMRATRHGGFADVELNFDGKTFTVFGKNLNVYAQLEFPGDLDHLIDELRLNHGFVLPAADLLLSDSYKAMMTDVTEVKDLGSGIVGGVECDSLAFRTKEVDWQVWIAQGDRPYPCRYVITTRQMEGAPQFSVQVRNWKTGAQASQTDFTFRNTSNATPIDLDALRVDLPDNFKKREAQ